MKMYRYQSTGLPHAAVGREYALNPSGMQAKFSESSSTYAGGCLVQGLDSKICTAVVKGDNTCTAIAAASILAKASNLL